MITPGVLRGVSAHAEAFRAAQPFRHVVIENFFDPIVGRQMLTDFPRFEDRHALNEMGEVGGKAVRMDVRDVSDTYRKLDMYLQTPEFLEFVSAVTGIPDLLYDADYVGGGTHENRDGQRLEQHVDFNFHPGTRWHRRLNLIVYLNDDWNEAWGGALELQTDPWKGDARGPRIAPLFNRAVIFETTENSWHGFSTITLPQEEKSRSRKSFAIYLYTRERPHDETAAEHATVYVPESMPAKIQAGMTLSDGDVEDLNARFGRLRGHLKFLYDRETQFASQIAALEGALADARDALRMPLQGFATQPHATKGLWPDGWAQRDFIATIVPTKKSKSLVLDVWAPRFLEGGQILHIALNGKRWEHHIASGARGKIELGVSASSGHALELSIRAEKSFSPARSGESADARELAWKLLDASLS